MDEAIVNLASALRRLKPGRPSGRVCAVEGPLVHVSGLPNRTRTGDTVTSPGGKFRGSIVSLQSDRCVVLSERGASSVVLGDSVVLEMAPVLAPHEGWLGRIIDPTGRPIDGAPLQPGPTPVELEAPPPDAAQRKPMGHRLDTGLAVFDTLLPIARGQRVGLFAGSGVGKSTLLAQLANGLDADVVVIALVGERGREVREFAQKALGREGMRRCIIVAATSDRSARQRRMCVASATATAEYFRDRGKHVLLLVDSLTRFAEAHREIATQTGEASNMRGFPASTAAALAGLCERSGPGPEGAGDITAIYSILVAGSDMEEPVADMARGVLDGHVILDRAIAERGRFPAIDIVRSVSRSLPEVASDAENRLLKEARRSLGLYAKAELMIQAGLYVGGTDPDLDLAIARHDGLDRFAAMPAPDGCAASFERLERVLTNPRRTDTVMPQAALETAAQDDGKAKAP